MPSKFIGFENVLINVEDVSWAQVIKTFFGGDEKPWSMLVHFRGVEGFPRFDYETEEKAADAYLKFTGLIGRAIGDLK